MGKYVAFHNYRAGFRVKYEGHSEYATSGGRPTSGYFPRFRKCSKSRKTGFPSGLAAGFSAGKELGPG